jgi:hypothetical protein
LVGWSVALAFAALEEVFKEGAMVSVWKLGLQIGKRKRSTCERAQFNPNTRELSRREKL